MPDETLPRLSGEAERFVRDPWVQYCAWKKLNTLYKSRWRRDNAAWPKWLDNPEREVRRVVDTVVEGRLDRLDLELPLVPFPKEGGKVRHFVRPSLDAEFSTLLLGVLLCPLLDARMWSFSFGGRWYSGMARLPSWDGGEDGWRFRQLPFSLADEQLFSSYRRSYGLFRRVAKWTAQTMLGEEAGADSTGGPSQHPGEYPRSDLPYLSLDTSRLAPSGGHEALWHARLDIASAYPCVRRDKLRERVLELLSQPLSDLRARRAALWGLPIRDDRRWPYPFRDGDVWSQLEAGGRQTRPGEEPAVRGELASRWMDLLDRMTYRDPGGVGEAWHPTWAGGGWPALPRLGSEGEGIPTGLTVSSVWFNAYLQPMDDVLADAMGLENSGARIRGAALRYVDDLVVLAPSQANVVDIVSKVVAWLQDDPSGTNLMPAHNKVQPELLREAMPPENWTLASPQERIARDGWRVRAQEQWESRPCVNRIDLTSLGPFVTSLVEQLSELGNPGMADMWGHGVGPRLAELHRLVRMEIGDGEIREDTRLAFAGRKLAGAPLPMQLAERQDGKPSRAILEIQRSLLHALRMAPWKPTLWDAAARLMVRLLHDDQTPLDAENIADEWIDKLAMLTEDLIERPWGRCAEGEVQSEHATDNARMLATSFVRAQFLHSLVAVVRDVDAAVARDESGQSRWSPAHWTGPLMNQQDLEDVAKQLPRVAKHAISKFSSPGRGRARLPWERAAVTDLRAATTFPSRRRQGNERRALLHELTEARHSASRTVGVLRAEYNEERLSRKDFLLLAVRLGVAMELTEIEVNEALPSTLSMLAESDSPWTWALRVQLHSFHVAMKADEASSNDTLAERRDHLSLREVLWRGEGDQKRIAPSETPAVGLPPDIVIDLVEATIRSGPPEDANLTDLMVTGDVMRRLAEIRAWQLADEPGAAPPWGGDRALEGVALGEGPLPPHPLLKLLHTTNDAVPSLRKLAEANRHNALFAGLAAMAGSERPLDRLFDCFPDPPGPVLTRQFRDEYLIDHRYLVALSASYESAEARQALRDEDPESIRERLARALGEGPATNEAIRRAYLLGEGAWEGRAPAASRGPDASIEVRMAQLKVSPWAALSVDRRSRLSHTAVVNCWPDQPNPREVLQALAKALPFRQRGDVTTPLPKLTILPEVLVPWSATPYLVATCRRFGIGLLAGTYWRPVPPAVRVGWSKTRRFANEALLVLPVERESPGFATRVVRVRKPRPAASELGLERALSAAKTPHTWRLLSGDRFFVFRHPTWGSFTVGICSDLLDPLPWALMRGEIAHMFFSAYNDDVDLFSVVTRTRAYEDYCNVVLVNHGSKGGSFAWSPQAGHAKEIARFQGENIDVVADITLPVASLLQAQERRLEQAIEDASGGWLGREPSTKGSTEERELRRYKTPPPGYRKKRS